MDGVAFEFFECDEGLFGLEIADSPNLVDTIGQKFMSTEDKEYVQ
jgi:hypothetical protein